ncbi:adhesion G-protein coupled receptor F3 [Acomys russatus]|uniref:adhesion G-protein coupled receptor F3 n=1 Tax=Acomys russatus TaxID=60746 RepID=UPI0021E252A1|nr:adhesion G-protein coupled receptor F3 [Acomys russatus]
MVRNDPIGDRRSIFQQVAERTQKIQEKQKAFVLNAAAGAGPGSPFSVHLFKQMGSLTLKSLRLKSGTSLHIHKLNPSGGKSGQQLNQNSGAGESVLVSSYVHLQFSSRTWPQELSKNFTLPTALASLSPRTLTALGLTTECRVDHNGTRFCICHPGYQWNATLCSLYPNCHGHRSESDPCICLSFQGPIPGYCQLLPPVPANLTLDSQLQRHGDTLNLTLLKKEEATNLRWFLKHSKTQEPILLWPGTNVFQMSSESQAGLSVTRMSRHWTGKYESIFEAQGFRWKLQQVVTLPLEEKEVVRLPSKLSVSCATTTGFQLSCCTPLTNLAYTATWSPGENGQASLHNMLDSQCLVLAVQHCPAANTTYTCALQGQNLAPLMASVSVTVIQDGDTTCPEDFLVVAWNITKADFMAQAPCPVNKKGMVKRLCGSDGIWGPVQNSCTEASILNLCLKAKLLLEGQGKPNEEVPHILSQLQGQVGAASTPSDLQEMLHTVTLLAKVVAETSTELTDSALKDLLTTTDKILDVNISSLWTLAQAQEPSMGSDFLKAVETLVQSLSPQQHPFSFSSSNVLLQSQLLTHSSPGYQMSFSAWPLVQVQIPRHSLASLVRSGTNVSITSLVLKKLDCRLPSNYTQELWGAPYTTPGLILVVSITTDGQAFTQAEVIMDFEDMNGSLHCVFWDHDVFQGRGGWSDKGCQVHAANGSTTQCICQHLTAFSILMSQHTVPEDPILDLLSQVGIGASILALLVCLAIYRVVWRTVVRNKLAFFRHTTLFNMVICLLIADACFLGSTYLPSGYHSLFCLVTAFLSHFFYLATFFWMLAQALVLAHQLLFVFHQLSKHLVLTLMVILGYLCPLGLAGVTLGLYLPQKKYLWEGKCLLNGDGAMLYTLSEPVLAIVAVNGLVLVIAVLKLLRPSLSEGPQVERHQALLGVLKALFILTPVFGLTWGLGVAIVFDQDAIVSHYIFTILNSLQGVFILVFGCLTDKKVLEALRNHFRGTQSSNSAISLATNETYTSEHSKERSRHGQLKLDKDRMMD